MSTSVPSAAARRFRILALRKRIAVATVAAFLLAWGVIFAGLKSDVSSGSQNGSSKTKSNSDTSTSTSSDDGFESESESSAAVQTYVDPVTGQVYAVSPGQSSQTVTQQTAPSPSPVTSSAS